MSTPEIDTLHALGQVQGQLKGIADLIRETSASTNRRIDDLRASVDTRFEGHGKRITRLEDNERSTAIKAAAIGAASGATAGFISKFISALVALKSGG